MLRQNGRSAAGSAKGTGLKILITGMGGELGTRVANLLEDDPAVSAIIGMDIDPPRRRLRRAEFQRIDPRNRIRTADVVRRFQPTGLVHIGTYEPYARSSPKAAMERTASGTIAALSAAASCGSLDRIVVRSGISIYGRRKGAPAVPDEDDRVDPTTPWGHSLRHAEMIAAEAGSATAATVTSLRFAPVVGPHFPSPLGRLLRQPMVPFAALSDPPFSVLHQEDAAHAILAALRHPHDGPVNVVGPGSVTASRAALMGRRIPVPVCGPGWGSARALAELTGAPIPEHIAELLRRGRTADGSRAADLIGFTPRHRTVDVIGHLHEWAEVTYLTPAIDAA